MAEAMTKAMPLTSSVGQGDVLGILGQVITAAGRKQQEKKCSSEKVKNIGERREKK